VKYVVFSDGHGPARILCGPGCGSANEATMLRTSQFYENLNLLSAYQSSHYPMRHVSGVFMLSFLKAGDVILYDGAFSGLDPTVFYCPTIGGSALNEDKPPRPTTPIERHNNTRIRRARSVIEHYFGRLKDNYPMFRRMTFRSLDSCDQWVRAGIILTNMSLIYVHPLREQACSEDHPCYHCFNLT